MPFTYVPLLSLQRELYSLPRGMARFRKYLQTIITPDGLGLALPSLVSMNPMGKEHLAQHLDILLGLNADGLAAQALAEVAPSLPSLPDFKVALVVADDLMGGWTNRYDYEYNQRFPPLPGPGLNSPLPHWLADRWLTGLIWTSETPSPQAVREALLTTVWRTVYLHRHGPALTLGDKIRQEGTVMAQAGCTRPTLDKDDLAYTRVVLQEFWAARDKRTTMECLFGDGPGGTLGFTPQGLSPWAGIALGLHEARQGCPTFTG